MRARFRGAALVGGRAGPSTRAADEVLISIVGTNDVHGELLPGAGRGGLVTIAGYVNALRSARGDGAVLLIDAGHMWQGTLESNLIEGAAVVAAYDAMGYVAAAVGNHEFDFGPLGEASAACGGSPVSATGRQPHRHVRCAAGRLAECRSVDQRRCRGDRDRHHRSHD